jgi:ferredoxin
MPSPSETSPVTVAVDRVRCTGHGICAQVLAGVVTLDEWGYPIVRPGRVDDADGRAAVALCPAAALRVGSSPRS